MSARQAKSAAKPAPPVEPTAALWIAIATVAVFVVVHLIGLTFHGDSGSAGSGVLVTSSIPLALGLARSARRQPERGLEYGLALNAAVLLIPAGFLLYVDWRIPLAQDVFLGGCVLAVAAAIVDRLAKREDARHAAARGAATP